MGRRSLRTGREKSEKPDREEGEREESREELGKDGQREEEVGTV